MQEPLPFNKVAILGVGLLGGSVGLALRRAGFAGQIAGFGHRQASLDAALAAGAVSSAGLELGPVVSGADLVILASPIGLFQGLLAGAAPFLAPDAIVTDVGSTKREVVAWAGKLLPRRVRFVGSHPIAGSDQRGVQYARADLFDGACCILTPSPLRERDGVRGFGSPLPRGEGAGVRAQLTPLPRGEGAGVRVRRSSGAGSYESAVETVEQFWRSLGMWTARLTPAAHDRYLAQVSHLPHATAAALVLLSGPAAQDLAGAGFLDSTRIAGGDPRLSRDIFLTNRAEMVKAIEALNSKLDRLAKLIADGNSAGLVRWLAAAQRRRQELMGRKLKRKQVEG